MTDITLLAIDTSTEACSAALQLGKKTYSEFEVCPQKHSQKILPMIQALMVEANAELSNIDYLVYGRGPGSFTGVRIGCGVIQGLALGLNKRAIGVSTLAAMAQRTFLEKPKSKRVCAAIDARMNEVYYCEYTHSEQGLTENTEEVVISPEDAIKRVSEFQPDAIAGTGWHAYPALQAAVRDLTPNSLYPDAESMLVLANQIIKALLPEHAGSIASNIEPVYLRDKVTWKKLPGRD